MTVKLDNLNKFKFKSVSKKRVIKHDEQCITKKLVRGICVLIDGKYNIQLDAKIIKPSIINKGQPDIILLPFTEESYEIRGCLSVFSRTKDEHGNYVRYIRNEGIAKFFPGNKKYFVPFCHNWVCSGHVIRRDGKLMFKFNECISPKGYEIAEIDEDD